MWSLFSAQDEVGCKKTNLKMRLSKNFKEGPSKNLKIDIGDDDRDHHGDDDDDVDDDDDGDDDGGDDCEDHLVSRTLSCSAFANQNWLLVSRASW